MSPGYTHQSCYLRFILMLSLYLLSSLFPSIIMIEYSYMCATFSVHITLTDLMNLVLFGKEYKIQSSGACE
jgi:hypothetical protein